MDDPQREIKQWLADKLTHGVAVKVTAATGISGDKLSRSKELESTDPKKRRQIPLTELKLLARYFHELPPGFERMRDWLRSGLDDSSDSGIQSPLAGAIHQARRRRGSSIRDVAEAMNIHVDDVIDWEDGTSEPTEDQLAQVSEFLHVDPTALLSGRVIAIGDEELGDATFISGEIPRYSGPRDVEKLGVVAAGDDGDFEFNGKVAEYMPRPKGLAGRPGVFALEIISESMYPAYRKFDPIYCDRQEPQIGDDVVIETFPEPGATVGKAFVKRLKVRTKNAIVVEQFNPPRDITFDPYAIKHLWRVVPYKELHGL